MGASAKELSGLQVKVLQSFLDYWCDSHVEVYGDDDYPNAIVFETSYYDELAKEFHRLILELIANCEREEFNVKLVAKDGGVRRLFTFDNVNGYQEVHRAKTNSDPFFWAKQVIKDEWFPKDN